MKIRPFALEDKDAVITLWERCNLIRPWNNPKTDIERMLKVYPEMFLVGLIDDAIIAAVMGGYDGHRGWIYYLGVLPEYRKRDYGRQMMDTVTRKLREIGCPKINILIRRDNQQALDFYEKIGYETEDRISLAKRLVKD